MRVPCIMRWPARIPRGGVCSEMVTAMDFLPTFAGICGKTVPNDRVIDGKDILPLMEGLSSSTPHDAFYYYFERELQAVRAQNWKLHLSTGELYDLRKDVGETTDVAKEHQDVVKDLQQLADACRQDIGDSLQGLSGKNVRPCGHVKNPKPLTEYDTDHPYMIAMYD